MVTNNCNQVRKNTLHCPFVYCQTTGIVLRQGVDFVLPLSQQQEEQEQPSQKFIRRQWPADLEYGT